MQDNQQQSNNYTLNYILIFLSSILLSLIAYKSKYLDLEFIGLGFNYWQGRAGEYYHSVPFLLVFDLLLCQLAMTFIISPFVFIVVVGLYIFKRDWLPAEDPHLVAPLNLLIDAVNSASILLLLVMGLETVGIL